MLKFQEIKSWEECLNKIVLADCLDFLRILPDHSVDMVVTSPPYWQQRDYGVINQIGLESTFHEYLDKMTEIFNEIYRVLKKDGSCWVNMGDCFNEDSGGYFDDKNNDNPAIGKNRIKAKKYQKDYPRRSLLLLPYRFGIKMIDEVGFLCRNVIIWRKNITQPTTAKNRFTIDFEPFFLFTKKQKYKFNIQYVKYMQTVEDCFETSPVKERRSVWDLTSERNSKHMAPYPEEIARIPILAGSDPGDVVLDPFMGSGTTAVVAKQLGRNFLGCDLSKDFCQESENRISNL